MTSLTIKPTTQPIIKYNFGLIEIPIKRGNVTSKIIIYSSLLELKSSSSNTKQSPDNGFMFVKCLIYLRNYLNKVGYKCTLAEMEYVTTSIARRLWKVLDKNKFEQQIAPIVFGLSKVLCLYPQ